MANPQVGQRGYYCDEYRHLWRSGLALSIYKKIAGITWDKTAKTYGTYYDTTDAMADFFGAAKGHTRDTFAWLDREGWLVVINPQPVRMRELRGQVHDKKERRIVTHEEWLKTHSGQCFERETMPWDFDKKDPLGRALYRLSNGKIKWYPEQLKALRKGGATDSEIEATYRRMVEVRKGDVQNERAAGRFASMQWKKLQYDLINVMAGFAARASMSAPVITARATG